jgi:hypothetical protein
MRGRCFAGAVGLPGRRVRGAVGRAWGTQPAGIRDGGLPGRSQLPGRYLVAG